MGLIGNPRNLNFANAISAARCVGPLLTHLLFRMGYATSQVFLFWHFVVWAASDAIDGPLARADGKATRLGAFLDPLGDKVLYWTEIFRKLDGLFWWALPFVFLLAVADAWSTWKRFADIYSDKPLDANRLGKLKTGVLFVIGIAPLYLSELNWFPEQSYFFAVLGNISICVSSILAFTSMARKHEWI